MHELRKETEGQDDVNWQVRQVPALWPKLQLFRHRERRASIYQTSALLERLKSKPEAIIFWMLSPCIVPVWAFTYLPTQDGPCHIDNAQIIKDCGNPEMLYGGFFEVRLEPLPNLTSHLALTALLYVFAPLTAEKVLVSIYVLGFAFAYRFFLGAFGPRCVPLSWVGLLLIYQRCFWMGFYNYCLGLILLWIVLACGPRPIELVAPLYLTLLFTAAYFTHLAIYSWRRWGFEQRC